MRILVLLSLLTYWFTHPGAVQHVLRLAMVAFGVLAHAGGGHVLAQGTILVLGSHWH